MARNLGEAFVQISPDLSGFGPELQAGVQSAMTKAVSEVEKANDQVEASFRETAQTAEQALDQIGADGFAKLRQTANIAGEAIGAELREGALEGDRALAAVDGDQFREVKQEAKKAGDQIGESLAEGAKEGDRALTNLAKSAGFAALAAGLTRFAKSAIDAFGDLGETVSKATVIFGDNVDEIIRYGDQASQALGQSKQAAIAAAADFAIFGKAAGLSGQDLAKFSTDLTSLASDLASFSNTTPEEAIVALGAALRGESEPIRRYGVLLNDAAIKAKALEMGIYDGTGALSAQQRVLAVQAEIFAQTTLAQGDFARTSDSLANQQKILAAEFKDLQVQIGQGLAPAFTGLLKIASSAIEAFTALPAGLQSTVAVGLISVGVFSAVSNSIQNLGVAAKTANIYLAGLAAAAALAVGIYTAMSRDAKQAEERQQRLNQALKDAGDPAATLIDRVSELVTKYQEMNPAAEEASKEVEAIGGAVAFTQSELADLSDVLLQSGLSFEQVTNAVSTGTDAYDDLSVALRQVPSDVQNGSDAMNQFSIKVRQSLEVTDPLRDSLLALAESGRFTFQELTALVTGLDETADAFDDNREANNQLAQEYLTSAEGIKGFTDILGVEAFEALKTTALATADAAGRTDAYTYALEQIEIAIQDATEGEQARWDAMTLAAQATEDTQAAQAGYNEELKQARENLDNARDALKQVADAQYALADAMLGAINSEINYRNQIDRTIEAIQEYTKTEDNATTTINEKDAALRDATTQILRQADASVQAAIDSGKLTEAQIAAGEGQRMMAEELRNVANLLAPGDPLRKNLLGYADELETQIPPTVETEIIADVTEAKENLTGLVTDAETAGLNTGISFAEGVALGLQRGEPILDSGIRKLIRDAEKAAKDEAGIRSPSELFASQVGAPIVDGIIEGIDGLSGTAVRRMEILTQDLSAVAVRSVTELRTSLADLVDAAEDAFSQTVDLIEGRRDQEAQARRVKDAEDRVAKAQEKLNAVLADSTSTTEEVTSAQKGLADAQQALEDLNYRLLESNYALIEQGPEGVATFENMARAAGLEAGEISKLVVQYQELIRLRKEAADQKEKEQQIEQGETMLGIREQLDRAIASLRTAFSELDAAARRGQNTASREVSIANSIVDAAKLFAQAEGAAPGSTAFFQKQLDAIMFFAGGRVNVLDDLAQIIQALQQRVRGYADGGIFNQPTIGMFGEAGPEAIIPISRPGRALELMAESGLLSLAQTSGAGGPAVQIQNATFASATDADLVAQRVNAAYRARTINV